MTSSLGDVADDGPGAERDVGKDVAAHLQAAALEVIAAVRVFLDAAEGAVRDPGAAVTLASSLAGRVRPGHNEGDAAEGRDGSPASGGVQRIPVSGPPTPDAQGG
ncbi:MAG: hypothetical protein ACR2LJ_10080 [Acidimicrobiales bacterium]